MEREELNIRDKIQTLLQDYTFEEVLEFNDITPEDVLVFMFYDYGLRLSKIDGQP